MLQRRSADGALVPVIHQRMTRYCFNVEVRWLVLPCTISEFLEGFMLYDGMILYDGMMLYDGVMGCCQDDGLCWIVEYMLDGGIHAGG